MAYVGMGGVGGALVRAHGLGLLWRGLDSAPGWGGQRAPGTHSVTADHRGEGADLGEGLAAAGKQEAAAHVTTVAAHQARSQ
ncbi:hypothetical protein GCM10010531_40550 [Blastococcus jejuensis]|uniref:Uncharacterized protein n=1 Tax=Blastococcus jejuensis TaxID=351224 RepID=A0ABP6PL98_9ACTN